LRLLHKRTRKALKGRSREDAPEPPLPNPLLQRRRGRIPVCMRLWKTPSRNDAVKPRMNTNKHQWNQRMRVPLRRNSRPSFSDCGANGRIIVRVRKFVFISVHSWFFNCMDTAKPERCSPTPSAGSTAVELMKSRKRWPAQLSNGHPLGCPFVLLLEPL
jgi:hypothetical protein